MAHRTLRIWASVIGLSLLLAAPAQAQSYTIAPDPFLTVLDNSGLIVAGGCVWTYAAGTTTPITTYSNNSGTVNSNPIVADTAGRYTAYLLAGTNYKFVYETACTPPAHGAVLRTADSIAGVPAASATVDYTCTAGETISAGQVVYLSDGSGSKTPAQCYKADSANAYSSSSAILVGIAPSAITSGLPGTVRTAGEVTGLSALSGGTAYYVGTAGALTATAPANARRVGAADSATSLVVTANPGVPNADNGVDCFRLTLTSGTPVTVTDVTAATTLYATPKGCNRIALFDTLGNATVYTSAEFSIAVPATTSQMYDVFAYSNSGVPTLELLAWTNDTTRATALVLTTTGSYTKSGDLTRRYLGSCRTTTVSGQTEDSLTKRYVWNYYNRVRRNLLRLETSNTWTYTTATWRQANGAPANQVEAVVGVAEAYLDLTVIAALTNGGGVIVGVAIGEDSTTAPTANQLGTGSQMSQDTNYMQVIGTLKKTPAVGRHYYAWLEYSQAANTTTWTSNGANAVNAWSGLAGWIEG